MRAFSFPPEDLDVQYKTVPEGVKPFPTPPQTPTSIGDSSRTANQQRPSSTRPILSPIESASPPSSPASSTTTARQPAGQDREHLLAVPDTLSLDSFSDRSSLASFSGTSIDDERLDQMLQSHRDLIEEIEVTAERAKAFSRSAAEQPSVDRGSASGESCSGEK